MFFQDGVFPYFLGFPGRNWTPKVSDKKLRGYKGRHNVSSAFIFDVSLNTIKQLLTPGYGIYKGQTNLGAIVGLSPDKKLPEIIELKNHPWFIGVQFHPEFKSRPLQPHPLFSSFIKAAKNNSN